MKKVSKKTRLTLIIVGIVVVLAILAAVLLMEDPEVLIEPGLWTVLFLAVLWLGIDQYGRYRQRAKQKTFDEGVSAKEGIEDRKKEWNGWLDELEKQGINRYELPFYLLVGEPQSGKSVMLQNSDLQFPFGQDRLSGIGGTRGCDWWFTDEAIVLDIAGRLFTHEGGAADRVEWEAFLKLLSDFRPLCPANGVILVIPCDALLNDSPEECAVKANKVQTAFLSLADKLEAQLPVYLTLTKGDRIFGFAESVHRLDAAKRHEMFGWSRPAEQSDDAFALSEVKAGFEGIVDRARALRSHMLVSARLPEALPEIDRLYAFPEELAGMWGSLEIYLKRIFSETNLVDRMSFRGVYLSSGLQTGVPIAKVCGEMLGTARESDNRALESLFTHQRAYFIKDLVRKRVFAEQGLVRPTEGRVSSARRSAVVGYGISAAIALAAVVGAIAYVVGTPAREEVDSYANALDLIERTTLEGGTVPEILETLAAIDLAEREEPAVFEKVFRSSRSTFGDAYVSVFDHRLAPALRSTLIAELDELTKKNPRDHSDFMLWNEALALLTGDIDFSKDAHVETLVAILPVDERNASGPEEFGLDDAIERRLGFGGGAVSSPDPSNRARVAELTRRVLVTWDGVLEPGSPWAPEAELGFVLAWQGIAEAKQYLESNDLLRNTKNVFEECASLVRSKDQLEAVGKNLPGGDSVGMKTIANWFVTEDLSNLRKLRAKLTGFVGMSAEGFGADFEEFDRTSFRGYELKSSDLSTAMLLPGGRLGRVVSLNIDEMAAEARTKRTDAPGSDIIEFIGKDLFLRACAAPPTQDWADDLARLPADIERGRGLFTSEYASDKFVQVYQAKCLEVGRRIVAQYPTWRDLAKAMGQGEAASDELNAPVTTFLIELREQFDAQALDGHREALDWCDRILRDHLRAVGAKRQFDTTKEGGVDWALVGALRRSASRSGDPAGAQPILFSYLLAWETAMSQRWAQLDPGDTRKLRSALKELRTYLQTLGTEFGPNAPRFRQDTNHVRWLSDVDGLFSRRLQVPADRIREFFTADPISSSATPKTIATSGRNAIRANAFDDRRLQANELSEILRDPVFDWEPESELPKTAAVLSVIRRFTVPASLGGDLHAYLLEWLDKVGTATNTQRRVDVLMDAAAYFDVELVVDGLPETYVDPSGLRSDAQTAGEYYVADVFLKVREAVVEQVREDYLEELFRELRPSSGKPLDVLLFATTLEAANEASDRTIATRIERTFDRDGRLAAIRREHQYDALHLQPFGELDADWAFDRFLTELQTFLLGAKSRVEDSSVDVVLEPKSDRTDSMWDIDANNGYFNFYFPTDARGNSKKYERVTRDMDSHTLTWSFGSGADARLAMRWSTQTGTTPQPNDYRLELLGPLAPLFFAWGPKSEYDPVSDEWSVEWTPVREGDEARVSAPFKVRFDRKLPLRPAQQPSR